MMSAERIISTNEENVITSNTYEVKEKVFLARVDIYNLLAKNRKEKEKDNFTNLVLFSLLVAFSTIMGIVLFF